MFDNLSELSDYNSKCFKMIYTVQEKFEISSLYIKNNKNRHAARREYMILHDNAPAPALNTFKRVYELLRNTNALNRRNRTVTINEDEELEILLYFQGMFIYRFII